MHSTPSCTCRTQSRAASERHEPVSALRVVERASDGE